MIHFLPGPSWAECPYHFNPRTTTVLQRVSNIHFGEGDLLADQDAAPLSSSDEPVVDALIAQSSGRRPWGRKANSAGCPELAVQISAGHRWPSGTPWEDIIPWTPLEHQAGHSQPRVLAGGSRCRGITPGVVACPQRATRRK